MLSADFLANYLTIGPIRRNVSKDALRNLPVLCDLGVQEAPPELLEVAEKVRMDATGLEERLVRRRVRDEMDRARTRLGPIAQEGMAALEDAIKKQLAVRRREQLKVARQGRLS